MNAPLNGQLDGHDGLLLAAHAGVTLALVGLIWTIQIVHYPLMRRIPADVYIAYEREHMMRITWVVGPLMLVEAATAALLIVLQPAALPLWMAYTGLALLAVIWVSTAAVQGPAHQKLARGKDDRLLRLLVVSNWLRTILWTARGVLALAMLHAALPAPQPVTFAP